VLCLVIVEPQGYIQDAPGGCTRLDPVPVAGQHYADGVVRSEQAPLFLTGPTRLEYF
jgi:hypothetical protein